MIKNIALFFIISLFSVNLCLAQDLKTTASMPVVSNTQPEAQWVWGEVILLNPQEHTVLVRFIDYETDTEKEITIGIDEKTTYENVRSFNEIKPQDTVSIDYILDPQGKPIAQNISVEKFEEAAIPSDTEKPASQ